MKRIIYLSILILAFSCKDEKRGRELKEIDVFTRAIKFYQDEQFDLAKTSFDTLISIDPSNGEYYFKRGQAQTMLFNIKPAINDFLMAIENNFENKKAAYLNLGTVYRSMGNYDSALFFYGKSLEEDTTYEKAKIERQELLEMLEIIKQEEQSSKNKKR